MALASSVCRVCLAGNIRMLLIDNLDLQQLFEKLTNSKLYTESDAGMPNTVCYVCHRQLQKCHMFFDMAHRSDKTMRDLLHNGIEVTYSMITMLSLVTTPTLSLAPTNHFTVTGNSIDSGTLATVKEEEIAVKIEEISETEEADMRFQMTLDKNTEAIDSTNVLFREIINEVSKPAEAQLCYCDVCNKKFSSKPLLVKHLLAHSTNNKLYPCNLCNKMFKKSSLEGHMQLHARETPYSCKICNKAFALKSILIVHMRRHTGEKPFSCNICKKAFIRNHLLTEHMRLHGENPYTCDICKKVFASKKGLKTHLPIHTGENACNICKKIFTTQKSLKVHMPLHTGERPYACNICNKAFIQNHSLRTHMQLHNGEKPYPCSNCERKYLRKNALMVHMLSHTVGKQHVCDICNRAFFEKHCLKIHMQIHNGNKPYPCSKCENSYHRKKDLLAHMESHSQENPRYK